MQNLRSWRAILKLLKEERKMKHDMLLLKKNMSKREGLCKQHEDILVKPEELSKLLKREVHCLSDAVNDQKQACALVINGTKVNNKELREREFMCAKREEDLASHTMNVTEHKKLFSLHEVEVE
jgi:hypothetical protein